MWELDCEESWVLKNWCFWTVVLEKTLESPLDCKEIQPVYPKGDQSWVFIGRTDAEAETLATWCEELTHWKRPWCWEGLGAGGEGDDRGWDGWMVSLTQWTWVWVNSGIWLWTGRPGVLQFMAMQRVRYNWATELKWMVWCCWNVSCLLVFHLLSSFLAQLLALNADISQACLLWLLTPPGSLSLLSAHLLEVTAWY